MKWRLGRVVELVAETVRTESIVLELSDWPGHGAGQHVHARLTDPHRHHARRSYSIASGPEDGGIALIFERLDDARSRH